jgi:mRNA interferase RelE/StbE
MKVAIVVQSPVYEFARRLAPEPRRAIKRALRLLRGERGDIRALEGPLTGYFRLRAGKYRILFRYADATTIEAIFAEERGIVYEVFEAEFLKKLKG